MNHWAFKYIGKPYKGGACGPLFYDCWGLVRKVFENELKTPLPPIQVDVNNIHKVVRAFKEYGEKINLTEIEKPKDLCIVQMRKNKHPCHIGIYFDGLGGHVLHAVPSTGVVCQTLEAVTQTGWIIEGFYIKD